MDCTAAVHEVKFLKRKFLNLADANVYRDKISRAFSKTMRAGAQLSCSMELIALRDSRTPKFKELFAYPKAV